MRNLSRRGSMLLGMVAGVGVSTSAAVLMGVGQPPQPSNPSNPSSPSNPPIYQPPTKPDPSRPDPSRPDPSRIDPSLRMGSEYFVTGDGAKAHLWMRDGTTLRWVTSADSGMTRIPTDRPGTIPDTTRNPSNPPSTDRPK